MRHTPGPWRVDNERWDGDDYPGVQVSAGKQSVAFCTQWDGRLKQSASVDWANAHLIAAAPDLLEACRRGQRALELSQDRTPAEEAMRAAIRKATGRRP